MKLFLKILAVLLLLVNGIGALYGGGLLIAHPDGSTLQLSMHWIEGSVFKDYLIPGLILFVANGLFSLFAIACLLFDFSFYTLVVISQGCVLLGWLVIQILIIHNLNYMHIIMGSIAVGLIITGICLRRFKNAGKKIGPVELFMQN